MAYVSPMYMELNICFMHPEVQDLYGQNISYATAQSAGMDLRACFAEEEFSLAAGGRALVPAGIAVHPITSAETPVAGFIYSRSGLGAKKGIVVAQGVGVIDADYRGEVMIMLLNTTQEPYIIKRGERVAQLVYQPIVRPTVRIKDKLEVSARGSGGFGHTGRM